MKGSPAGIVTTLLATLASSAVAEAKVEARDPVAVLPFRNLNRDTAIEWLGAGMAETLVSDIKSRSTLRVVEREQLDRALQEIELQAAAAAEISTAVNVGRIVGAETVVVGGFQRSGDELRITARFVAVETGVVLDAAKATGPMQKVFDLQDQIVSHLLGTAPTSTARPRPSRTRPKASKETLSAYELYAKSLSQPSSLERTEILKEVLAIDPGFSYAQDDLRALAQRLKAYAEVADAALREHAVGLRRTLEDPKAEPAARQQASWQLEAALASRMQHRALLALGEQLYTGEWPAEIAKEIRPRGLFDMFQAYQSLKRPDAALQVGELFLKQYPLDARYPAVAAIMQSLVETKKQRERARTEVEAELTKIEVELADNDSERCEALASHHDDEGAARFCLELADRLGGATEQRPRELSGRARWRAALALLELGRIAEARAQAEKLLTDDPELATRYAIRTQLARWPRD